MTTSTKKPKNSPDTDNVELSTPQDGVEDSANPLTDTDAVDDESLDGDNIGNVNGNTQSVDKKPRTASDIALENLAAARIALEAAEKRVSVATVSDMIIDVLNRIMDSDSEDGKSLLDVFGSLEKSEHFDLIADPELVEFRFGTLVPSGKTTPSSSPESNGKSGKSWFVNITKDGLTTDIPMRGDQTNNKSKFDEILHDIYHVDKKVSMGGKSREAKEKVLKELGFTYKVGFMPE